MKIAFVGARCSGKSKMWKFYKEKFAGRNDVAFIEEAASIFFREHSEIEDKFRFSFGPQSQIQTLALEKELMAKRSGAEIIICDRSVLDAAVYVLVDGDKHGSEILFQKVKRYIASYGKLFLLDPAGIPFKNNAVRKENEQKRAQLHATFINFFEEKRITYDILRGELKEKIKIVDKLLKPFL